jgi:hypothetical protein
MMNALHFMMRLVEAYGHRPGTVNKILVMLIYLYEFITSIRYLIEIIRHSSPISCVHVYFMYTSQY